MDSPQGNVTLCRLEQWNAKRGEWSVIHAGINLLHPERYSQRLAANGKVARCIETDTGIIHQAVPDPEPLPVCPYCGDRHSEVDHGMCLL